MIAASTGIHVDTNWPATIDHERRRRATGRVNMVVVVRFSGQVCVVRNMVVLPAVGTLADAV
jgi:hypothetical protein